MDHPPVDPPPRPATDPLPASAHAPPPLPPVDVPSSSASTSSSSDAAPTPTASPPLSRSASITSTTSLLERTSSDGSSDDWDDVFPLDKLSLFEFLDQLALPRHLEKFNQTVIKKHGDKVRQQYERQKKKVKEFRDVDFERFRTRYSEGLDKVMERWNDTRAVSTREKAAFVVGVANIFITGLLIGGYPEWVHVWYSVQMLYFMPVRYYTYHKRGYHYFLADLCYFTNLLLLLLLFVFPNSRRLMIAAYCLAYGNNAFAIAMWRNSMVFHSLDKVTSLFIHIMPPVVLHCLVHLCDPEWVAQRFPAISRVINVEKYGLYDMILWATIPYAIWQLAYHFLITVRRRDKIAAGRPTSFTYLRKSYANTWIGKCVLRLPNALQEPAFMLIQYSYALITMIPCPLWFYHRNLSALFLSAVGLWSIYNGATFYIDVFGKRFQKELEQLKKDVAKWQQEAQNGSADLKAALGDDGRDSKEKISDKNEANSHEDTKVPIQEKAEEKKCATEN